MSAGPPTEGNLGRLILAPAPVEGQRSRSRLPEGLGRPMGKAEDAMEQVEKHEQQDVPFEPKFNDPPMEEDKDEADLNDALFKDVASQLEAPTLESMEDRIRSASKLPKVLLPQVARILCGLPEERLPEELKWRQVEGAHYAGSVLELHLEPEIPFKDDLHMPDGIHCQQITMAHSTSWQAAHGILSEG
eukprot:s1230_g23.t1